MLGCRPMRASFMQKSKKVLLLINGPWQASLCIAALKTALVSDRTHRILPLIVDADTGTFFHSFTTKILAQEGLTDFFEIEKKVSPSRLAAYKTQIERKFDVDFSQIDEVFTFGTHRSVSVYFCNAAENAHIYLYEEGLRSYLSQTSARANVFQRLYATLVSWVSRDALLYYSVKQLKDRISGLYLLLQNSGKLHGGQSDYRTYPIDPEAVKQIMGRVGDIAVHAAGRCKIVLIVGQYYASLKQLSPEMEYRTYLNAAQSIVEKGFVPVWRGHIRQEDLLFERLKAACPELTSFNDMVSCPYYPLEFYTKLLVEHCAAVVSISSSSLLYFDYLFGIPAFTLCTEELIATMKSPHKESCELVRRVLPPYAEFGSASDE